MQMSALRIDFERQELRTFVKGSNAVRIDGTHHRLEFIVDGDVQKLYCGR